MNEAAKTIGENVREAIDFAENGLADEAFLRICFALEKTLIKSLGKTDFSLSDYKNFIDEHWDLIRYLCFPRVDAPYLDVQIIIGEISRNPHRQISVKEIVVFLINYVLKNGKLPPEIAFSDKTQFEKEGEKLFVPGGLVSGLLTFVIVHPANKNETVPDKYWINIGDFKMFVSEFWGRIDLAERIVEFYLERN